MTTEHFSFSPIGTLRTSSVYRFEAPRQGVFGGGKGIVELFPEYGGDALSDLQGMEKIWLLFLFHLNHAKGWKAKVLPPFSPGGRRISIFATRAPYRPNPIGLSCVTLTGMEKNRLFVSDIDLLDGTPILDIKPYIPEADAFPEAEAGWRDENGLIPSLWHLDFSAEFQNKNHFLVGLGAPDLCRFCEIQLSRAPLDGKRKRLYPIQGNEWELGCRTWRIRFVYDETSRLIHLTDIHSHYRPEELLPEKEDPYGDKEIHRAFLKHFPEK